MFILVNGRSVVYVLTVLTSLSVHLASWVFMYDQGILGRQAKGIQSVLDRVFRIKL